MREVTADEIADFAGLTSTRRKMLIADLFCGAGGASTGIDRAMKRLDLDYELVCVNHWPTAIDTHALNHPQARHYCQDIATVRPHKVCPEGYLDLLTGSPTCTHHSVARGGKPTSDQQRSDPWHLVPWVTELRVSRMMVENVWEYVKWGPVDPVTLRPIKEREGEYYRAWIDTFWKLGATSIEWRKLNAANYGGATTRNRYFGFFRFDNKRIIWPAITHAKSPATGSSLQRWKPAREIIDWSIKGRSIFNRPVPLAPKTLARILAGAQKFAWPEVFIVMLLAEMARSLVYAIRYAFARRHSAKPDVRRRSRKRVMDYTPWLRKLRAAEHRARCVVVGEADPMLVTLRNHADGRSVNLPAPAVAANGLHIGLAEPVIINGRKGNKAKPVSVEPIPTLDTKGGVWLAEPMVLATGQAKARTAGEPLNALTTVGAGSADPGCARPMLVEPFILNRASDGHGDTRAHSVDQPAPTPTTSGAGYVVEPFVLSQASGGAPRAAGEPLPTAPSKDRFALVVPITHSDRSNRARDVDVDPLPTLTTAHRGELAFITAQFGEREGQAPRVHSVDNPAPAVTASGHINLVQVYGCDVLFRMLEPAELAAAMGFIGYRFAGNKTEQVKQVGNAVSVEQAEANTIALFFDEAEPAPEFLEAAE